MPTILDVPIINSPGFKALVPSVSDAGSCGLYWDACGGGTDTEFESKFSNSYVGCYELSADNN